jgi:hypothetical protein
MLWGRRDGIDFGLVLAKPSAGFSSLMGTKISQNLRITFSGKINHRFLAGTTKVAALSWRHFVPVLMAGCGDGELKRFWFFHGIL